MGRSDTPKRIKITEVPFVRLSGRCCNKYEKILYFFALYWKKSVWRRIWEIDGNTDRFLYERKEEYLNKFKRHEDMKKK